MIALSPISFNKLVRVLYRSVQSKAIDESSLYTTPHAICNSLDSITAVLAAVTCPSLNVVTARSCISLNAFVCCLDRSVFLPTKLVSGRSLHSSSENLIDG